MSASARTGQRWPRRTRNDVQKKQNAAVRKWFLQRACWFASGERSRVTAKHFRLFVVDWMEACANQPLNHEGGKQKKKGVPPAVHGETLTWSRDRRRTLSSDLLFSPIPSEGDPCHSDPSRGTPQAPCEGAVCGGPLCRLTRHPFLCATAVDQEKTAPRTASHTNICSCDRSSIASSREANQEGCQQIKESR